MGAAEIIQLLAIFGPSAINLITTLIEKAQTNGTVSAAEWATLAASLQQTAADRMKAVLAAQNIDPASPQGLALLALVK